MSPMKGNLMNYDISSMVDPEEDFEPNWEASIWTIYRSINDGQRVSITAPASFECTHQSLRALIKFEKTRVNAEFNLEDDLDTFTVHDEDETIRYNVGILANDPTPSGTFTNIPDGQRAEIIRLQLETITRHPDFTYEVGHIGFYDKGNRLHVELSVHDGQGIRMTNRLFLTGIMDKPEQVMKWYIHPSSYLPVTVYSYAPVLMLQVCDIIVKGRFHA